MSERKLQEVQYFALFAIVQDSNFFRVIQVAKSSCDKDMLALKEWTERTLKDKSSVWYYVSSLREYIVV